MLKNKFFYFSLLSLSLLGGCSVFDEEKELPKGTRVAILEAETDIMADPVLQGQSLGIGQEIVNIDWPQSGGVPHRDLGALAGSGKLIEKWSTNIGEGDSYYANIVSSPVILASKLFTLDSEANLYVLNSNTGAALWNKNLTPKDEDGYEGFGGGVAVNDTSIFVTNGFGEVVALSTETGKQIWKQKLSIPFRAAPIYGQGMVFVINSTNQLFALSAENGKILWEYKAAPEPSSRVNTAPPSLYGDALIVPFSSGEIVAFQITSGQPIWSESMLRGGAFAAIGQINAISASPIISNGIVYLTTSGLTKAINLADGKRIWQQNFGSTTTPWSAGDVLFMVSHKNELVAINKLDGRVHWVTKLDQFEDTDDKEGVIYWQGPILVNGQLFLTSTHGKMAVINALDGKIVEQTDIKPSRLTPIVANGIIYVLSSDGYVTAYGG